MRLLPCLFLLALLAHASAAASVTLTVPDFIDKDDQIPVSVSVFDGEAALSGSVLVVRSGDIACNGPLVSGVRATTIAPNLSAGQTVNVTAVYLGDSTYAASTSTPVAVAVTDLPDISGPTTRVYGPYTQVVRFTAVSPLSNPVTISSTDDKSYIDSVVDNEDGTYDVTISPLIGNVGETINFVVTATDTVTGFYRVTEIPLTVHRLPAPVADDYDAFENVALEVDGSGGLLENDFGADIEVDVVTEPTHGTLVWDHAGHFTYEPDLDWVGEDTFTYRLIDQAGFTTGTATVTITTAEFGG